MRPYSRDELDEIISRDKPGHRLVESAGDATPDAANAPLPSPPTAAVDAVGPSLETFRSKYARPDATFVDRSAAAQVGANQQAVPAPVAGEPVADAAGDERQPALVMVESTPPGAATPVRKGVLVGKHGRVIAEQG